jgi:hypothetical protein
MVCNSKFKKIQKKEKGVNVALSARIVKGCTRPTESAQTTLAFEGWRDG